MLDPMLFDELQVFERMFKSPLRESQSIRVRQEMTGAGHNTNFTPSPSLARSASSRFANPNVLSKRGDLATFEEGSREGSNVGTPPTTPEETTEVGTLLGGREGANVATPTTTPEDSQSGLPQVSAFLVAESAPK
jgi:hypothetical protein